MLSKKNLLEGRTVEMSNPFPLNPYPPDNTRPAFDLEIYEDWKE